MLSENSYTINRMTPKYHAIRHYRTEIRIMNYFQHLLGNTQGFTDLTAKQDEYSLGKILSMFVFKDKVSLIINPKNFIPFSLGIYSIFL
jgi:hypothetical protein